MALSPARLCHCCHSRLGTTRFPVLQPTHTPSKGRCASQVTLSHNPSMPLTDTWPPWHQTPGEPKGFGGWCVSAARSASLLSGARCRNVSRCKPLHQEPPALVVKFRRGTAHGPVSSFASVTSSRWPLIGRLIT